MRQVPFRWDTRTRTRKGRTRICSVTITPYPIVQPRSKWFVSQLRCKGNNIFWNLQIFSHFFLKKNHFSSFHLIYLIKKHKNMGNKGDNSRI